MLKTKYGYSSYCISQLNVHSKEFLIAQNSSPCKKAAIRALLEANQWRYMDERFDNPPDEFPENGRFYLSKESGSMLPGEVFTRTYCYEASDADIAWLERRYKLYTERLTREGKAALIASEVSAVEETIRRSSDAPKLKPL